MNEILFGTTNEAKINQVRGALAPNIKVRGITNKEPLPSIDENGKTAAENARKKALAYAKWLNEPVLSMDNALYIDGLTENQPGLNVRRIPGFTDRPTDTQLLEYYSRLIANLGKVVTGYWEFGFCIAAPDERLWEATIQSPRVFTDTPSSQIISGYPLESIQIDPKSGKHISDMTQEEKDIFWQEAIGRPLLNFVLSVNP